MTICLGIESTAHTFGVGIVDEKGRILANARHSHTTQSGGLIPRELSDHHRTHAQEVLSQALAQSKFALQDIDVVAFAKGPGIGPALEVGALVARSVAQQYQKPLLGVNHCIAHLEIARQSGNISDPLFVYASGGNTQIIGRRSGRYRVYGETLDIGIGNLLDSFGRALGLGFPAGPVLDKRYFEGKNLVELPYSVKGMDLVFSGLLTAATQKIGTADETDLIYSLLHTAFAELTEVTERALSHTGKKAVVLTGGVAASAALQQMLSQMAAARKVSFHVPPRELCTDNGAMIAVLGLCMHSAGIRHRVADTTVNQRFRTDSVDVTWK